MDYAELSAEDLVRACTRTGDPAAWEEFIRRFHRLIATVALRVARRWGEASAQVVDDLVQDTYLKLCADDFRLLRSFQPQHPDAFYGYLKVIAGNLAHDHFKAAHSVKRGSGAVSLSSDCEATVANSPAASAAAAGAERRILLLEVDALLRKLAPGPHLDRDRRVFWLYYRAGLTASAIAALPSIGLGAKGVESTILRLTQMLKLELVARRQQPSKG